MSMQCQSRGISARSNLAETCHAMLVSTGAMSKSRHQQLLQSLPVNFCGPRVYPHKLVDHWFQPHCDFDWFSTSTCDMESVSAIWVGHVFQGRCLPKAFHLAHGITLWCQDVNICWNSVGDSHWFSHFPIHFPRDFDGFPKISRRSPEVGHAVFPDGTLVEFNGDCTLKVMWVYKFIWVITCFNVFINPL